MNPTDRDKTLAMAGIMQAGHLVQQLAYRGEANDKALDASIRSVFAVDAEDTESIYGGAQGVAIGLVGLRDKLGHRQDAADFEIARYVLSMIQLEGKLRREPEMIQRIARRIGELQADKDCSISVDQALFEQLAELYISTVSLLQPRIIVQGEQGHLAKPLVAAEVRSVLFAGIRSAYLWAQLGGRRWHLFLKRKAYSIYAKLILAELQDA